MLYISGKKPWPYPKFCRWHVVRVSYRKEGGATDGAQNIVLMMRMEEKLTPTKLNTWAYPTVSGCLEERVGVKHVHLGWYVSIRICEAGSIK